MRRQKQFLACGPAVPDEIERLKNGWSGWAGRSRLGRGGPSAAKGGPPSNACLALPNGVSTKCHRMKGGGVCCACMAQGCAGAAPRGALLVGTRPQRGGGTPPPPLRTPKLSHGTMCFVGAGGAGDFVLGIRQGEFFLFGPMCLYSKYSEFRGEFKNG